MLYKILKKDIKRNKVITATLFVFIMISSLLVSSASSVIIELFGSLDNLFEKANAPHFVQMHSGEINVSKINQFALNNNLVKDNQIAEMIVIDGSNIFFGDSKTSDKNSVMDNGFVKQNDSFDLLLDLDNQVIQVSQGEIAVPIYYMQTKNIKLGDKITISDGVLDKVFTVTDFVRDVQMNPSIISSKRFVVNESDFDILNKSIGKVEYMIEFLLLDINSIGKFTNDYESSKLPQKGPTINYSLFKTLNALTDGIVAAVIILVSILLIIIALLCLRFTILTTMEEDYKDIGVMKAIGIRQNDIKKIYLLKYIVMTAFACLIGYLLSLKLSSLFSSNIALYIGTSDNSIMHTLIPIVCSSILFLIVILFCKVVLKRFKNITAVEALRSGAMGTTKPNTKLLQLKNNRLFNVNLFLSIKDVFTRSKIYLLLFTIFVISSFIVIVPLNFLNTLKSPSFISYMGVGKSDMRIDVQQSNSTMQDFTSIVEYMKNDKDIKKYSPHITCKYRVQNSDGIWENINVEIGDFSIFPLNFLQGATPKTDNEIALSQLNADGLGKTVGDKLIIEVNESQQELSVSGIYQDITNGGKTAKAMLPYNLESTLWYTINADVKHDININDKISEYEKSFQSAKVTGLESYLSQTLNTTVEQVKLIAILAAIVSILISILIVSLFIKMLVAKDTYEIAIMKSIGFGSRQIQLQYIVKTLLVLGIGIVLGTILSNTMGQSLVGILMSFTGASQIQFVINQLVSYILYPLSLVIIVAITTSICTTSTRKIELTKILT